MLRLRELRKSKNMTMKELGAMIGVGESTVSQYENGKRQPDFETLSKLAQYFNVSVDYLLGRVDHNVSPVLLHNDTIKIPVLKQIAAGIPIDAAENILEYVEIPASLLAGGKSFFAWKLTGDDSMAPEYRAGDIIIFECCETYQTGDDCLILINGNDAIFKRIERKKDGIMIEPLNPHHEIMFFTNKTIKEAPIRILGVARELRRRK